MNKKDEIKYLLERYLDRAVTEQEYQRLFELLEKEKQTQEWEKVIGEMMKQQSEDQEYKASYWEPVIKKILQKNRQTNQPFDRKKHLFRIKRIPAAAAVLLLIGFSIWFLRQNKFKTGEEEITKVNEAKNDILPGGNKAILMLANGQRLILDSIQNGTVALQGNAKVIKLNNGQLSYTRPLAGVSKKHDKNNRQNTVLYNTISTPRGGQYQVILPDGSKVWLNAASSIKFPTAFTEKNRKVQITGEAYFEIKTDANHPFIVKLPPSSSGEDRGEIKVLGTEFNIMAYNNEPAIRTTLLKGAVKITEGKSVARLKPGQQAILPFDKSGENGGQKSDIILINNLDVNEVIAWKNGLFQFSDDGIEHVMRQVARWYNVEIVYENKIPEGHITGKIPKNTNLSDVLKIMELSGIHSKIEGRKVIILAS